MTGLGLSPTVLWATPQSVDCLPGPVSLQEARAFSPVEDCELTALDGSLQNIRPKVRRKKVKFAIIPQQSDSTPDVKASWVVLLRRSLLCRWHFYPWQSLQVAGLKARLPSCRTATTKPPKLSLEAVTTHICQRKQWEPHYLNPFKIAWIKHFTQVSRMDCRWPCRASIRWPQSFFLFSLTCFSLFPFSYFSSLSLHLLLLSLSSLWHLLFSVLTIISHFLSVKFSTPNFLENVFSPLLFWFSVSWLLKRD